MADTLLQTKETVQFDLNKIYNYDEKDLSLKHNFDLPERYMCLLELPKRVFGVFEEVEKKVLWKMKRNTALLVA